MAVGCVWQLSCGRPATGHAHIDGYLVPLCDEHLRPALHPRDVRARLCPSKRPDKCGLFKIEKPYPHTVAVKDVI